MVQKCGGLPLLIIVTGRAMAKENDALRWMHASREFSVQCTWDIWFEIYCPTNREVSVFELVEYWIEEGLISGNCTDTYKRGHDIVDVLSEDLISKCVKETIYCSSDLIQEEGTCVICLVRKFFFFFFWAS